MWSSRLYWRLFFSFSLLILILATSFAALLAVRVSPLVESQVRDHLYDAAVLARQLVEATNLSSEAVRGLNPTFGPLGKQIGIRLTVVDRHGTVLVDSHEDPDQMQNHRSRPEFRQAANNRQLGEDERTSRTLGIRMYYLALPVVRDEEVVHFVRVAFETERLRNRVSAIQSFVWGVAGCLVLLAMVIASLLVRRILRPLEQLALAAQHIVAGEDVPPVRVSTRDEISVLATAVNDMQRRLAEQIQQLRANTARLETVLQNMVEGIIAIDADERIQLANDASLRLFDASQRNLIGRPLYELTRARPVQETVAHVLATARPAEREFETGTPRRILSLRATRLAHSEITPRASASPAPPSPDSTPPPVVPGPSGVLIVIHDVTDLRRLENLRQELVANVSHELKTPLTSIKAYAETLRLGAIHDPEHNETFLARIEEQADRLNQLILDLLQLARMESREEAFEITDVSLGRIVDRCVRDHRDVAASKPITFQVDDGPPLRVRADADGLRTILDNLLDNAIKYTPAGGTIHVWWEIQQGRGLVAVRDTGPGIADKYQHRVFERFFRADKARSRELGGTGLGLAIVKHLTEAFGGDVQLESRPGHGSTFRIFLPLADPPD